MKVFSKISLHHESFHMCMEYISLTCFFICSSLMFIRFTNALAGLNVNDMIQRTGGRLESLHSEGVHVRSLVPSYFF